MKSLLFFLSMFLILGCEEGLYLQTVRSAALPESATLTVQNFHQRGVTRLSWPTDLAADSYELQYLDVSSLPLTWVTLQNTASTEYLFQRYPVPVVTERYRFRIRKWRGNSSFAWSNNVVGAVGDAINDSQEPNNTKEEATPLSWQNENRIFVYGFCSTSTEGGPYIVDTDLDWYYIDIPPNRTVTYTVNNAPGEQGGNYFVLYAVDEGPYGNLTANSISFSNTNASTRRFYIRFRTNEAYYSGTLQPGMFSEFGLSFSQMSITN